MKKGFTLAEVLITLGVIGVVAAITMPMMMAAHREKQFVAQLKKIYSNMSQSYARALVEYGEPDVWELVAADSPEGANAISSVLSPYFSIQRDCKTDGGCWVNDRIIYLDNSASDVSIGTDSKFSSLQIADGTLIAYRVLDPNCKSVKGTNKAYSNVCGEVYVDLNGVKNPNQFGYDVYKFYITRYGFLPAGFQDDTATAFENTCADKNIGTGCAAWVVQRENMDYLHCDGLSWNGNYKCNNRYNFNFDFGL